MAGRKLMKFFLIPIQKKSPELFDFFPQSDSSSQNLNEGYGLKSNLERFSSGIVAFNRIFLTTDDFFFDPAYQDESLAVADLFLRVRSRRGSCSLIQNLFCYRAYSRTSSFFLTNGEKRNHFSIRNHPCTRI